jgi:hypothetical protein
MGLRGRESVKGRREIVEGMEIERERYGVYFRKREGKIESV